MNIRKYISMKNVIILVAVLVTLYYVLAKPLSSLWELWPLVFLLCPLMHVFMHNGHNGHNNKHLEKDHIDD